MSDEVGFKSYWLNGVQIHPTKEQVEQMEATARQVPHIREVGLSRACATCGSENYDEAYFCVECNEIVSTREMDRLRKLESWAELVRLSLGVWAKTQPIYMGDMLTDYDSIMGVK